MRLLPITVRSVVSHWISSRHLGATPSTPDSCLPSLRMTRRTSSNQRWIQEAPSPPDLTPITRSLLLLETAWRSYFLVFLTTQVAHRRLQGLLTIQR